MVEFRLGDVGFVFGGREGEDGRGVEDCGGWERGGGEDSTALGGCQLVCWVLSYDAFLFCSSFRLGGRSIWVLFMLPIAVVLMAVAIAS